MTKERFLEETYLRECEAEVIQIDGEKVYLDQTLLYPTGGGQEHDQGKFIQDDQNYEVIKVKREKGKIVHYVKNADNLKLGKIKVQIDWDRRYGLMRHHSLLHVLGAVMYKKFGALCTGNQIYPDKARIDFNEINNLDEEQVKEVIQEVNQIISEDKSIFIKSMSRQEAEQSSGMIKTAINLLPPSVQRVRIVCIDSIDEQACGGTHVQRTSEIGTLCIDRIKSKGKNNKRFEVRAVL
ncbi:alanyl-tRNA editing protein [Thermoflavimicrobium daqui]|jgi:Ser-tRNA(Ala) deacylase AlaX|uniref:Alanyl-tRNA editing protein n=1 Tax=Thermoflavimicrobium daqui TaxID=2137476 RepID=A0A364K3U4_9BACL|nr:alanyl-tRNA editing protein [Thermoflavimicrobium daqui]RAL24032.1 alanyl-tRNA editing protein [Thermoflavimicrobium daqui]